MNRSIESLAANTGVQNEKQKLAHIMSQKPFHHETPAAPHRSLLRELLQSFNQWMHHHFGAFFRWLSRVFPHVSMSERTLDIIFYSVTGLILAILLIWIVWMLVHLVRHRQVRYALNLSQSEMEKSDEDYLQLARTALQKGDNREAIRFGFLSLLFYMAEREWIHIEKWKTNREYGEELRAARPDWQGDFRAAAGTFDKVWYGNVQTDRKEAFAYIKTVEMNTGKGEGYAAET